LVFGRGFTNSWYWFFGDDQYVDGSLWLDVADGEAEVIFVFEVGGDFAIGYFGEECFFVGPRLGQNEV
jgi:hypothetical protein